MKSTARIAARLLSAGLVSTGLFSVGVLAGDARAADWPAAADIPDPQPAAAGLAGAEPPNIVRFLKVIGAGKSRLSPDGDRVAYITQTTGEPQLWIVDAEGGAPRQLTFGSGVSDFEWTPQGELMVAADTDGDEREGFTILSADGMKERRLLPPSDAFNAFGDFSEDGERFAYATTARNGVDFDIYVGDAATGASEEVFEGRFGFFAEAWRPGAPEVLVTETSGEDAALLHLLNVDTGEMTTLFDPETRSDYRSFAWRPDGSGFYLSTDHEREFHALAFIDLSEGGDPEIELLDTPDHDVEDVTLADGTRYLAWTTNEGGYSKLHIRDLRRGRDVNVAGGLPKGVYGVQGAEDAARLLVRISGPTTPGSVWTVDLRNGDAREVVAPANAGLDLSQFTAPTPVSFPARDDVMLHGLVYLPKEGVALGEKPPVVLGLHGGPTSQSRPGFDAVTEYLLSRGIAVFELNFRGSTGYGKTFARLNDQRLRPNELNDIADALEFLKARDDVDASRVVAMGGSYGGYLVNAVMGEFPELFDGGASFVGVTDWVRALEGASPALKASDRIEYGDISDPEDRAFFEEISPIRKVDRIRSPMLVVHGANDPRDPVTESDALVEAVRKNGVDVTYLRFKDEGHSIRKLANRVHAYREVVRFLERQLAPTETQLAPTETPATSANAASTE